MSEQVDCVPPDENVPIGHGLQSVALLAATISATNPASQLIVEHVVALPPKLYVPAGQF